MYYSNIKQKCVDNFWLLKLTLFCAQLLLAPFIILVLSYENKLKSNFLLVAKIELRFSCPTKKSNLEWTLFCNMSRSFGFDAVYRSFVNLRISPVQSKQCSFWETKCKVAGQWPFLLSLSKLCNWVHRISIFSAQIVCFSWTKWAFQR